MSFEAGEENTFPIATPSQRPWPTYPRNTGRWPDPPPVTIATLPFTGASARISARLLPGTRFRWPGCALRMPAIVSSTNARGSLMIFFILRSSISVGREQPERGAPFPLPRVVQRVDARDRKVRHHGEHVQGL